MGPRNEDVDLDLGYALPLISEWLPHQSHSV